MRQETFAILFLMRKGRPKKNGLAPIFARITTGGLRQEVYTQCDSNPETWNQHKERAMGTNKLHKNAKLGAVSPQIGYLCHKGTGACGHRAPGHPLPGW